jgi:predicted DNA-binding protein (MmcQ/YjbR family)
LPETVRDNLLTTYLFKEYLEAYDKFFAIPKTQPKYKHARYTWEDTSFRNFMVSCLSNLEPQQWSRDEILFEELDEFSEIIFVLEDMYQMGYSINKKSYFRVKFKNIPIGCYGITFNKKSHYTYKSLKHCEGFFIRKKNWLDILEDEFISVQFLKSMKHHIKDSYNKINSQLCQRKARDIKKHVDRADFGGIISLNTNPKFNEIGLHKSASEALYLRKATTQKFLESADDDSQY